MRKLSTESTSKNPERNLLCRRRNPRERERKRCYLRRVMERLEDEQSRSNQRGDRDV